MVIVASLATINEHLKSLLERTKTHVDTPSPQPFTVSEAPGKGLGVFASRDISAGEVIIRERPILLLSNESGTEEHNYDPGHLLRAAVASLSDSSRRKLLDLKNAFGNENGSDKDLLQGIFTTNSDVAILGIGDVELAPVKSSAVFAPTIARFNHSCTPSASFHFDSQQFAGAIRVLREIKSGEEITISYTWTSYTRAERQSFLSRVHFFDCTCIACSLPPEFARESDRRRRMVTDIALNFKELSQTLSWDDFVRRVEDAVQATHSSRGRDPTQPSGLSAQRSAVTSRTVH
ncbi:hypothetical protein RQP46_009255 [Phenoliferia psychrophenolica]